MKKIGDTIGEVFGSGEAVDKNVSPKRKKTYEESLAFAKTKAAKAASIKISSSSAAPAPAIAAEYPIKDAPVKSQSLEPWPDSARGVPNVLLRNALFGVSQIRVIYKERTLIASSKDVEIRFKGESFNQTDLDVFEMLLHFARLQPFDQPFEFTANSFLKALGRKNGRAQYEQLKNDFARLMSGYVEITYIDEKKSFMGTLIYDATRDDCTKTYTTVFKSHIMKLFDCGFTLTDWEQRQALGRNNLAKWLQGHYATHARPYPVKVETLHKLCGSADKELFSFRQKLKAALDELVRVGSLQSWDILPGDLVFVQVVTSNSQRKHLLG